MPVTTPLSDAILRSLSSGIEGEVRPGLHDRMLYATDASLYQVEPLAVIIPTSIEDAARAVRLCAQHELAILPRGGGTSLAGQCTNHAVVLDLSAQCTRLLSLDPAARRCRVEPGLTIDDLNAMIRESGLFFAPDPATSKQAAIGGCIGNNAAGARSIVYGRTSENLSAIRACLADGTVLDFHEGAVKNDERVRALTERVVAVVRKHEPLIRNRFPKTVRRNAGYGLDLILQQLDRDPSDLSSVNLAKLLCGSEGTLAVTLEAELLLHPIPVARGLAVVAFDTVDDAMDALLPILKLKPSAVELLDDMVINLARAQPEYRRYVDLLPGRDGRTPQAVLYVEFSASHRADELNDRAASLQEIIEPDRVAWHTEAQAMLNAWKLRKAGEPLLHGIPGDRKPITFVEDNAVPPERLAEFVRRFRAIVEQHGTKAAFFAHASVGVLHVRPLLDIRSDLDRKVMQSIATEVADLAGAMGGVMSGEHGDGRVRGPLLERFYGPDLMHAFREVKAIFDPRNRLNPGNIVEPGPIESMVAHLRVKPEEHDVVIPEVETYYDYSDQHGFGSAVEMCNGAGVCRKKAGGTMCPSYMATRDERHSTRGRGNALRLAITGQSTATQTDPWNDPETMATLELCLSCKACKTECPSNVDIAKLKAEYIAQSDRANGGPDLRRRVMASIHRLNQLASLTPGLTNAINHTRLARLAAHRFLGVDPRRSLPHFAKALHRQWHSPRVNPDAPAVVLLADTFTQFNEPNIALAAREVLEACGYRVELCYASDLGRAAMSLGLLPQAIRCAEREIDRLEPYLASDMPILTLEPSCQSAIVDDWLSLRIDRPIATRRAIAGRAQAIEDFVESRWLDHPRQPEVNQLDTQVLLHGHCHQKALWGVATTTKLMARVTSGSVMTPDTGCCGMAGSFGYSHFDLSMNIAELSLAPAIRGTDAATVIASGTSCRHQIRDATGQKAMHPIELVARSIMLPLD